MQPKDSALVMFREPEVANPAISYGGGYLAAPNVGVQGSRGAAAIGLLATLVASGRIGVVARIDWVMDIANQLAEKLRGEEGIHLWAMPKTGVTVFRPINCTTEEFISRLPVGMLSTCIVDGKSWLRSVAANPLADIDSIFSTIQQCAEGKNR